MLELYGNPASTCTRKVLCTLHELGHPYELRVIDLASKEQKGEPHLVRQPFGKIPTIDDEGLELYESRAICRYLCDEYGEGKLVPAGGEDRAHMNKFIDVESSYFSPNAMTFIYHHLMKRTQDEAALERAGALLETTLDVLERRLADHDYLAGKELSLADIVYLPYIEYLQHTPAQAMFEKRAKVSAWWQRCASRPSWQKASGR